MSDFDLTLKAIQHYKQYPAMIPYVGSYFHHPSHKRLLIIGESNYLDKHSETKSDSEN